MAKYADVVLPLPIGDTFTYALPASLQPCAQVGCSVIVPFGNRKMYSAIIVRLHDDKPDYATKEALELNGNAPLVLPAQLRLWRWIADYYLCTLGDVYKAALPSGLKLESESSVMYADDFTDTESLTPSERRIYDLLEQDPVSISTKLLCAASSSRFPARASSRSCSHDTCNSHPPLPPRCCRTTLCSRMSPAMNSCRTTPIVPPHSTPSGRRACWRCGRNPLAASHRASCPPDSSCIP